MTDDLLREDLRYVRGEYRKALAEVDRLQAENRAMREWAERVAKVAGHSQYASWPPTVTIETFVDDAKTMRANVIEECADLARALDGCSALYIAERIRALSPSTTGE